MSSLPTCRGLVAEFTALWARRAGAKRDWTAFKAHIPTPLEPRGLWVDRNALIGVGLVEAQRLGNMLEHGIFGRRGRNDAWIGVGPRRLSSSAFARRRFAEFCPDLEPIPRAQKQSPHLFHPLSKVARPHHDI